MWRLQQRQIDRQGRAPRQTDMAAGQAVNSRLQGRLPARAIVQCPALTATLGRTQAPRGTAKQQGSKCSRRGQDTWRRSGVGLEEGYLWQEELGPLLHLDRNALMGLAALHELQVLLHLITHPPRTQPRTLRRKGTT